MADIPETCGNCLYFVSRGTKGDCHRHAPALDMHGRSGFPLVDVDNWCGDHFKKLPADVAEAVGADYPKGRIGSVGAA